MQDLLEREKWKITTETICKICSKEKNEKLLLSGAFYFMLTVSLWVSLKPSGCVGVGVRGS